MYNRTLNRPMFRRGGRAGGGIMTGVERPGYDGDSTDTQLVTEPTKVEQIGNDMTAFNKAFPQYNSAGSDFFMNLGSNILAAPGGNPILQTIGTAAREPLAQMQKTNMANVSGKREVAMAMWNNLDEDTKTRMMKDAKSRIDNGVFDHLPEDQRMKAALEAELYSKGKSPMDKKENRIKDLENIIISKDVGGSLTEVAQDIATHIYNVQNNVYEGAVDQNGNPLSFATQRTYFKDNDIGRLGEKEDGTLIYELTENGITKYGEIYEGKVLFDYRTGKLFKKQGNMLIEVIIGEKQTEE